MSLATLRLGLMCLGLATGLAAQTDETQTPDAPMDVKGRVSRVLQGLTRVPSFECQTKITAKATPIMRQLGQGQTTRSRLMTVKEGEIQCWTKEDGNQVLATRGGSWVMLDRDAEWIPCRRPEGSAWRDQFLADPVFLAERLLHLMPQTEWKATGAETLGEKAVRTYGCRLTLDAANHLVRTGALPRGGEMGGFMVVLGGQLGGQLPEPEREIEITVYEDPASRLPLKITAHCFVDDKAMGNVRVQVAGAGGQVEEEEEEEEAADGKKKPSMTVELEIDRVGQAKAGDLSTKARDILGGK